MSATELELPLSKERGQPSHIDTKDPVIQVQPVTDYPTPVTTPDEQSPHEKDMAVKLDTQIEISDERARKLAAMLTLEEQVCNSRAFPVTEALELLPVRLKSRHALVDHAYAVCKSTSTAFDK